MSFAFRLTIKDTSFDKHTTLPVDRMSLSVSPTLSIQQPEKNATDTDRMLLKQGRCPNCRLYTHERRGLRLVPLTNAHVYKGRCLICHPMKQDSANLGVPSGSAEQAPDENGNRRRSFWIICVLVTLAVVCIVIVGVYFGVIKSSDDSQQDDDVIPGNTADTTATISATTETLGETETTVTETTVTESTVSATELPEEADPLYTYVWAHGEDGVISSDEWIASPQASLESCMKACDVLGKTSGNYFEQVGAVEGWPDDNCFCTSKIICIATVLSTEVDRIETGHTFSSVKTSAYDICDDSYCVAWPYMCS